MGLKRTEHISKSCSSKIQILWRSCPGSVMKKGDEKGVYKTINGGKNWKKVLGK